MEKYNNSIELLNENYEVLCEVLLIETLGAFENQYNICKEIAPIILEMYKKHIQDNVIDIEISSPIKQVQVEVNKNIEKGMTCVKTNASIYYVNNDSGKVIISINVPQSYYMHKNDDYILKEIMNCLSHEFMHANVFMQRMTNNADVPDELENYDIYLDIIHKESEDSLIYRYAYGMYSTYYQEMNAIVSQTSQQLKNQLGDVAHASNDEIRNALKKTEPYQIYTRNAYDLGAFLKDSQEFSDIWDYLLEELDRYGISITSKELERNVKKIINCSNEALKKIMKNAMYFLM